MRPRPFLLAVVGGSASGKTRLAHALADHFADHDAYVIPEDDYYVDAGHQPGFVAATFNFDEPAAKDHALLASHLAALREGQPVDAPQYDFTTHCRCDKTVERAPAGVLIVEGLHLLASPELAAQFDLTIFVDACDTTRLARRIQRDVAERGRTEASVKHQFNEIVRPMHALHVEPQRDAADLVVENMGAPDFKALAKPVVDRIGQRRDAPLKL
ncbi:uridine kinase [uncultured Maricaulis sp.]|uniref:uridine kinase n=1 Tax=uncultured Maricaulis sp. TaxID=174710 RepID=UPI0030D9E40F|tara:strand:+ start:36835 stop:37476 length:642 start_codon:yes stop_codon:yes gene_type:complete